MKKNPFKDRLKEDFGLDLDIAGETGNSRENPVIVLAENEVEAARTELLYLYGLGRGRGIWWQTTGTSFVEHEGHVLVRRRIESKEPKKTQIIRRTESYYFHRPNIRVPSAPRVGMVSALTDSKAILDFPYQIGWLHYTDWTDYEIKAPGLGYSLAYKALNHDATIYVYPTKRSGNKLDLIESEIVAARNEYLKVNGEDSIKHDWHGTRYEHGVAVYMFMPRNNPGHTSSILVAIRANYFIKVRYTFRDEPITREMFSEFNSELFGLITNFDFRPSKRKKTHRDFPQLICELEARDVVFRGDFDASECRSKAPWLAASGKGEIEADNEALWQQLFDDRISEEAALDAMTDLMVCYYGRPYPLSRKWSKK